MGVSVRCSHEGAAGALGARCRMTKGKCVAWTCFAFPVARAGGEGAAGRAGRVGRWWALIGRGQRPQEASAGGEKIKRV